MGDSKPKILAVYDFRRLDIIKMAKSEAEPYLNNGDARNGWLNFLRVMRDHEATEKDLMLSVGTMMVLNQASVAEVKEFINEFN